MALVLADRVQETSTTTGTGTLTLDGASSGYQTFSAGIGNGNTCYYTIQSDTGAWEVGVGTVGAGTLARTTLISSSTGSAISFSGTLTVFVTYPAEKAVYGEGTAIVAPNGALLPVASGGTGASTAAAALTSLGAYPASNPSGYGTGTVTSVGITAGSAVVVSGSPITTNGNMTVGVSTKLAAINSLSGAGFFTQNGSGAIAGRTIQAGTGIDVQHGNGSSQDPVISNTGVLSVSGTAPVVSSGGTTPAISMAAATAAVNGYLTSTDWSTFNAKLTSGGALGTPSSGTVTNLTGTASININGTVGATTANTGAFTTLASSDNFTPTAYTETIVASGTVGASATLAITAGTVLTATLTSATACTFTMPTATAGKSFTLLLKQPAAGTPTTATFTGVKWNSGGAPTITATLGRLDIIAFVADGTNWYGTASQGYTY
jgi:hypothetical protein